MPVCWDKYWQSGTEVKKGQSYCDFAQRVPKTKKSTDPAENNDRITNRGYIVQAIDIMMRRPDTAQKFVGHIGTGLTKQTASAEAGSSTDETTPLKPADLTFAGKPVRKTHWQATSAQLCSLPGGPDPRVVDAMHNSDSFAVNDAYCLVFQFTAKDKFPRDADDMPVLTLMHRNRASDVGSRQTAFLAKAVCKITGKVDWSKVPLYVDAYNDAGKLSHMTYINGDTCEVLAGVNVDRAWSFIDARSDDMAHFQFGSEKRYPRGWLEEDTGPKTTMTDEKGKVMTKYYNAAQATCEAAKRTYVAIANVATLDLTVDSRTDLLRCQTLQAARKRQEENKQKPRVMKQLSDIDPKIGSPNKRGHQSLAGSPTPKKPRLRSKQSFENVK